MTTFLLIRHGESEANRNSVFAGHYNANLEPRGVEQANSTARYIAGNYKVDKIYASDLNRAYDTACALSELIGIEIIPDENLREISAGKWEGVKFTDIHNMYPDEYELWLNHIGKSTCVDGESVAHLGKRVYDTLTKIAEENDGKTIAVATHATPIRAMQSIVETGSVDDMENIPWVSNASVSVFEFDGASWRILSLSVDEHLGDLRTTLPKNV